MLNNIRVENIDNLDGTFTEHVIIDRGNNEFTSMPKSVWDEMQAKMGVGEQ